MFTSQVQSYKMATSNVSTVSSEADCSSDFAQKCGNLVLHFRWHEGVTATSWTSSSTTKNGAVFSLNGLDFSVDLTNATINFSGSVEFKLVDHHGVDVALFSDTQFGFQIEIPACICEDMRVSMT